MRIIDYYFRNSILVDIIAATVTAASCYFLVCTSNIITPKEELLLSTTSDIANVAFTSAGFVLTFLTLLVSFKISAKPIKKNKRSTLEDTYKKVSLFDLFLSSGLYTETIRHLKNGVKELIIVAIVGYALKLSIPTIQIDVLFYFNVFGIVLIALVLWRSLLVLSGVLSVQDKKDKPTEDG